MHPYSFSHLLRYRKPIRFRVLPHHAECIPGEEISINLMTGANPGHSLIHELLHDAHPEWSEKEVRKETTRIWRRLDTRQRYDLYRWLFRHKFRK